MSAVLASTVVVRSGDSWWLGTFAVWCAGAGVVAMTVFK
jgi:hypothetical protein